MNLITLNGSKIQRSRFGVGKLIGGELYLHRQYLHLLPPEYQETVSKAEAAVKAVAESFEFNAVKVSKKGATLFLSLDFDTADEPVAGEYYRYSLESNEVFGGYTAQIWHHKWLWVQDDYTGFSVQASIARSQKWLSLPDIDFSRIGSKQFWEASVVPRL